MADPWSVVGAVLAFIGGAGAVWAAVVAQGARRESRRSAAAAEESAKAAAGSLQVARGEQARATERTDVDWAREELDDRPGHVALRNVGSTTACEVQALVAINGEGFDLGPMDVPPLGYVYLDATAIYDVEAEAAHQSFMEAANHGYIGSPGPDFDVRTRITWRSALGTPGVREV